MASAFPSGDTNEGSDLTYPKEKAKDILYPTLEGIKKAVSQKDIELLSTFIAFPLNITTNEKVSSKSGNPKNKVMMIQNFAELKGMFDDIFNRTNSDLISCLTVDNMTYDRYKGFSAAYGGIWISDVIDNGKRNFFITSITLNPKPVEMWMEKNCNLK